MATDADRLKIITENIERGYQSLRRAAGAISGLLSAGQATCDEVRAYNLWALAFYNTQRGMLATLRAQGEQGVPELPPFPTLFAWRGVSGEQAWNIDCKQQGLQGLAGALRDAMQTTVTARKLSTAEIEIVTQDQFALDPESAPSFSALLEAQAANQQQAGLGAIGVIIAIAGVLIAVSVAIVAIMQYLETSAVQESNSKQVALQADAFANYAAARLECLKTCTAQGAGTEQCVATCNKLVDKPDIKLPGQKFGWGWLQWTGFTVVAGVGTMAAFKIIQRKREGRPIFELPPPP